MLGSGALTISGSVDGTDALILTAGDILVSDGDLDLSGGDFNAILNGADDVNITKVATGTAAEEGLKIDFTGTTGTAVDQRALVLAVTSADADAANDVTIALDIQDLPTNDGQGRETAIRIGDTWDALIDAPSFDVGRRGDVLLTLGNPTSGTFTALSINNGSPTGQTANTEVSNIRSSSYTRVWATGGISAQREVFFGTPTYAFSGSSTISDAANLYIENEPQAGTNATLTRS
jgi:hypothetical protein